MSTAFPPAVSEINCLRGSLRRAAARTDPIFTRRYRRPDEPSLRCSPRGTLSDFARAARPALLPKTAHRAIGRPPHHPSGGAANDQSTPYPPVVFHAEAAVGQHGAQKHRTGSPAKTTPTAHRPISALELVSFTFPPLFPAGNSVRLSKGHASRLAPKDSPPGHWPPPHPSGGAAIDRSTPYPPVVFHADPAVGSARRTKHGAQQHRTGSPRQNHLNCASCDFRTRTGILTNTVTVTRAASRIWAAGRYARNISSMQHRPMPKSSAASLVEAAATPQS